MCWPPPSPGAQVKILLLNRQENTGQISAQFLPQEGTLEPGSQGYIGSDRFVGEPGIVKKPKRPYSLITS
ncbi:MAG: iron complex outermembrane recepter protein [Marinobacter sp. T13-3]|nr:MAG: iron complex outermembrane recepter protein [Marinobacter sp. T13-3]